MSVKKPVATEKVAVAPEKVAVALEKVAVASEVELISLDEFVLRTNPNPGSVASFKAEAKNDKTTPRSLDQWKKDFDTQSERVYK